MYERKHIICSNKKNMNPPIIGERLNSSTPTQWTLNPLHASYDTLPKRPCVEVSMKNGDYACTVRMLLHKSSPLHSLHID